MGANSKYKNSVFSFLFSDPDILRELYSALEGITLPSNLPIDVNTLSNILFMGRVNDISFTIDDRLVVLIEHQSTLNNNMPLRLLIYIAHLYEKITDRRKMYQTKLIKIPAPEFIVLYNGKEPYPEHKELKLSDAFKSAEDLKKEINVKIPLELTVQVYNINRGYNEKLLKKCETLYGYSIFIEQVRENRKKHTLEEAVKESIKYCIENDVLKEFLEEHSSEVMNMLMSEFKIDEAISVNREEAWESGREQGLEQGLERGLEQGRIETARNILTEGLPIEFVQKITGLDVNTIENLRDQL